MKLQDFSDSSKVKIIAYNNKEFVGKPMVVDYSDDTESGEDEIVISLDDSGNNLVGFKESEIMLIEAV